MNCYAHPEQSECRGLCRRQAELRKVETIQLRAAGGYRHSFRCLKTLAQSPLRQSAACEGARDPAGDPRS